MCETNCTVIVQGVIKAARRKFKRFFVFENIKFSLYEQVFLHKLKLVKIFTFLGNPKCR